MDNKPLRHFEIFKSQNATSPQGRGRLCLTAPFMTIIIGWSLCSLKMTISHSFFFIFSTKIILMRNDYFFVIFCMGH